MKIAGTNAETEGLRIRWAIFMLGGAPTAREVLLDKSSNGTEPVRDRSLSSADHPLSPTGGCMN
jgi:hypothetical protein